MVVMAMDASFFSVSFPYHDFGVLTSTKFGGMPKLMDAHRIKTKYASSSSWSLRVKANANLPSKWMILNQDLSHQSFVEFGLGSMVNDNFPFRQTFSIRSYEIGAEQEASIETIMNLLQETMLNYAKLNGTLGDAFSSPPDLAKDLIWVITRMQVEVDCYPTWGDIIQIDVCASKSGKNGVRCDLKLCDCITSEILARASINMALMNKSTRRLSKLPSKIQAKLSQIFVDKPPILVNDTRKLPKLDDSTADHICSGLMAKWSDLDTNEHVNNVKYLRWILESVPKSIIKNHVLASMTLEYHQECREDCMVQSLTSILRNDNNGVVDSDHINCHHMLQLENGGGMIMKGWTTWRQKYRKSTVE